MAGDSRTSSVFGLKESPQTATVLPLTPPRFSKYCTTLSVMIPR